MVRERVTPLNVEWAATLVSWAEAGAFDDQDVQDPDLTLPVGIDGQWMSKGEYAKRAAAWFEKREAAWQRQEKGRGA